MSRLYSDIFHDLILEAKHLAGPSCSRDDWVKIVSSKIDDSQLRGAFEHLLSEADLLDNDYVTAATWCRAVIDDFPHRSCGRNACGNSWNSYDKSEVEWKFPLCWQHTDSLEKTFRYYLADHPGWLRSFGFHKDSECRVDYFENKWIRATREIYGLIENIEQLQKMNRRLIFILDSFEVTEEQISEIRVITEDNENVDY